GRLFAFIVDQNTLEPGNARHVATAASRFFTRLTYADRSALMLLPVGPNVPFTWAHERVREGLQRVTGLAGPMSTWEFGSLSEARDIANRNLLTVRSVGERECRSSIFAGGGGGAPGGGGTGGAPSSTPSPTPPPSGGTGGDSGNSGSAPTGGSSGSGSGGGGRDGLHGLRARGDVLRGSPRPELHARARSIHAIGSARDARRDDRRRHVPRRRERGDHIPAAGPRALRLLPHRRREGSARRHQQGAPHESADLAQRDDGAGARYVRREDV